MKLCPKCGCPLRRKLVDYCMVWICTDCDYMEDFVENLMFKMKRDEFYKIKHRKFGEYIDLIDYLVLLPQKKRHDSGYRIMNYVAFRDGKPICMIGGGSDSIRMENIDHGDFGIDCLGKSGLFRLFPMEGKIKVGVDVSSFCISIVKGG